MRMAVFITENITAGVVITVKVDVVVEAWTAVIASVLTIIFLISATE
jgi:hypothetical protein